ncbi:MAG: hypothetical protein WC091_01170 [Sulfuricellaceae bacterium]
MFTVEELACTPWPVNVKLMQYIEGAFREYTQKFVAHFRCIGEIELQQIIAAAEAACPNSGTVLENGERESTLADNLRRNVMIFCDLVVGWDEVDEAFSADVLTRLMTGPRGLAVAKALNEALFGWRFNIAGEVEKNSPTSPAPGVADEVRVATTS